MKFFSIFEYYLIKYEKHFKDFDVTNFLPFLKERITLIKYKNRG